MGRGLLSVLHAHRPMGGITQVLSMLSRLVFANVRALWDHWDLRFTYGVVCGGWVAALVSRCSSLPPIAN